MENKFPGTGVKGIVKIRKLEKIHNLGERSSTLKRHGQGDVHSQEHRDIVSTMAWFNRTTTSKTARASKHSRHKTSSTKQDTLTKIFGFFLIAKSDSAQQTFVPPRNQSDAPQQRLPQDKPPFLPHVHQRA